MPGETMNPAREQDPRGAPGPVTLRPERPGDEAFLFQVYASTREEELALTNWDGPTRAAFLDHQFRAMRRGYAGMFPEGQFSIVELDGEAIGRMVLDRAADQIRVVDLALLPGRRNRGIGTLLMRQVCAEAATAAKPVRLHVLKGNRALQWYSRLGFVKCGDAGIYEELEWQPAPTHVTRAPQTG